MLSYVNLCVLVTCFMFLKKAAACKRKMSEASVRIAGSTRFSTRSPLTFVNACKFMSTFRVKMCYKSFFKYRHEQWSFGELDIKRRPYKIFLATCALATGAWTWCRLVAARAFQTAEGHLVFLLLLSASSFVPEQGEQSVIDYET